MPDPHDNLLPTPGCKPEPGSLFESTSQEAGHVAARFAGVRYQQILSHLDERGGACIFEVAAAIGCHDHQISGRFGELVKHDLIIRTGQRRTKPETGCDCDVYQITLIGKAALHHAPSSPHPASPPVSGGTP